MTLSSLIHKLRQPSPSDAARTLGASARRQHHERVIARMYQMREELGLPPVTTKRGRVRL